MLGLGLMTLAFFVSAAGCGGDDDDDDGAMMVPEQTCRGGESFECRTRNGQSGRQFCNAGTLGACMPNTSQPSGGSGGSSASDGGTADDGGSEAGRGGRGGRGGQGGSAGQAGSAGSTPQDSGTPVDAGKPSSGAEQCDNGADDDGDGDVDCQDDDCAARECLPVAPDGWTGPTALRVGASLPASCDGAYGEQAARGGTAVNAPAATCSACSCTPMTPGCATFVDMLATADPACGGASRVLNVTSPCSDVMASPELAGASAGLKLRVPAGTPSCAPSAQNPTKAAPGWQLEVQACEPGADPVRGGCAREQVCAPKRPGDASSCIVRTGDHACPAGGYSERRLFYTAIEDTRSCSACNCAQDCSYGFKVHPAGDTTCTQAPVVALAGPGTCSAVAPTNQSVRVALVLNGTGACAQGGGQPTGAATAGGVTTACCMP